MVRILARPAQLVKMKFSSCLSPAYYFLIFVNLLRFSCNYEELLPEIEYDASFLLTRRLFLLNT